ncbi:septum formation initiator family protein [Clostridium sp. cel8]|jgi:cell division protein FtsB|uniref:FtsB family cell division protein n=1 Tax=Clostridium sp. cel8 TaxID=2663123 RepID=UPI0015F3833E|nr:septum formation initiator family protein [Clostridium sp. cel8]MBA5851981.1 septum formation initiator family protein [Clostridium sp. cel8]
MKGIKIKPKNVIVLLLVLYVGYIFVSQQITMWNIKKEINNKYVEEQKIKQKNIKLQDEVKMSTSDMYIEKLARERLGFIKQGETPVINIKN